MTPGEQFLVTARELPPEAELTPIDADTAEALVSAVREAVAAGKKVVITPDRFAAQDGEVDTDMWVALVSVLVVDGAVAIYSMYTSAARRVLDTMTAIQAADEGVIGA